MVPRGIESWVKISKSLVERSPGQFVLIIAKISNSPACSFLIGAFVGIQSNKLNRSQSGFEIGQKTTSVPQGTISCQALFSFETLVSVSDCNKECSGDETQSCGGDGAKVTVYSNAQPKKFLGQCIQDYQDNRILNDAFKDQGSTDRQVGPRGIDQNFF